MNEDVLDALILAIAEELDYDLAKQLDPDTAEMPEEVEKRMEALRKAAIAVLPEDLQKLFE